MRIIFFTYMLLLSVAVHAQSYEDEVRQQYANEIEAWNAQDIEGIGTDSFNIGFGFRNNIPRTTEQIPPEIIPQFLVQFFSGMDYYRVVPGDMNVVIDGEIALIWGYHIEEFRQKGMKDERVRVRSSATLRREPNGHWKYILSHRDIQKFDADGRYIQDFIE